MLRFNIASLIKRQRQGRHRAPLPAEIILNSIEPTTVREADLRRILFRMIRAWRDAARDRILPAYRAALPPAPTGPILDSADDLGDLFGGLGEEFERLILTLSVDLRTWANAFEEWHRQRWLSLIPTGAQLETLIGPDDVADTIEARLRQNVSLIRSISSEARTRIEGIIFRGFTARSPIRDIAKEINAALSIGRARAIRIASDQTRKLAAELDTARMEQAGIGEFIWRHSGKEHYRPWHKERDRKRFKLRGDIPPDDMPGIPPFCGCHKQAVIRLRK